MHRTNYPDRADAAMDVLGAVLLAACIATPVALWWFNLI